jgi:hypothetical protein
MTMNLHKASYRAQTWIGQLLIAEITDLSLDAAREIARTATLTGHTGRLMSQDAELDYCEVYPLKGDIRRGTFAETTLVRVS